VPEPAISVQDTASWVAMYRALESERLDALFHDQFARRLAGESGAWFIAHMPKAKTYAWPMVVRTAIMDEIIVRLAPSLDAVLNLAAGLDARPYRLALPPALRWFEVDFPEMLARKTSALAYDKPVCVLERVPLDQAGLALVISEGLLVYLDGTEVGTLADDLALQPSFRFWLTDVASPFVLRMMKRSWGQRLGSGAAFKFAPEDAPAFFGQHGWHAAEYRSNLIEGGRLHRLPLAWFYRFVFAKWWHQESVRRSGPMAGVILLENAKVQG